MIIQIILGESIEATTNAVGIIRIIKDYLVVVIHVRNVTIVFGIGMANVPVI